MAHILWKLLIVHQLLQENTGNTHTQMKRAEDHDLHLIFFLYGSAVFFLFFEAEHHINPYMFLHYKKGCIVLYCIVLSPVGFFKVWLQESKIS